MRTSTELLPQHTYEMGGVIGHGTYGQIYLATRRDTGVKVAIRVVPSPVDHFKVQVEREIELQRQAVNEHVVQLQESFVYDYNQYIVLELGELGNLNDFIDNGGRLTDRLTHSAASRNPLLAFVSNTYPTFLKELHLREHPPDGGLNEEFVRSFLSQLASGIQFLRSHDMLHRDLKPQNIVLRVPTEAHRQAGHRSDMPLLQMTDFGAPRELESVAPTPHFLATLQYMAPEVFLGSDTSKADLWSIGVILFKMAFGMVPFEKKGPAMFENVRKIGSAWYFPDDEPVEGYRRLGEALRENNGRRHRAADDIKDLIRCLLTAEADKRIDYTAFYERAIIPREGLLERDTRTVPSRDAAADDESASSE